MVDLGIGRGEEHLLFESPRSLGGYKFQLAGKIVKKSMELGQEDDENFGSSLAVIMHGNVAAQVIENRGTEHDSTRLVPDVSNRNPSNLNSFLEKLEFTDVIGEPHGFRSHDCVYRCAFRTYNWAKKCCYLFLSLLYGGPLALCCGCYFACLGFEYIWCITPCTRALRMHIEFVGKIFGYFIKEFCNPCFESIGKIFSGIKVKDVTETV